MQQLLAGQRAQEERLERVLQQLEASDKSLGELKRTVEALAGEHKALALANEQANRLGELHWQQHVIQPMAGQLFPVFDLVVGFRAANRGRDNASETSFKAIQSMLQEFFSTYGIEYFVPKARAKFDPALMKVVKMVPTCDSRLQNRVQRCMQVGFKRGQGAAIRPASVALWRYQPPDRPRANSG